MGVGRVEVIMIICLLRLSDKPVSVGIVLANLHRHEAKSAEMQSLRKLANPGCQYPIQNPDFEVGSSEHVSNKVGSACG